MPRLADKFAPNTSKPSNENKPGRQGVELSLELALDDGAADIIPYSWLRRARFAADRESVIVYITDGAYRITGRRLRKLVDGLKGQTIDLIAASDAPVDPTPGDNETPYVTSVTRLDDDHHDA